MTVYDIYDEMLKNDTSHVIYQSLLSSAEGKLCGDEEFTAFELCALIDGMAGFKAWDVPIDYWTPNDWDDIDTEGELEEDLREFIRYDCFDICSEYVTRKLCCLIDTNAPREEIEEWYSRYKMLSSDCFRNTDYPMSDTEMKIFIWFMNQPTSPEAFAESLSSQDIHSLLEDAYYLPNHDLPLDEADSEYQNWSKYQIVSQYIKTTLCYWLDQKYNWNDIDKWYRLNIVYNHVA